MSAEKKIPFLKKLQFSIVALFLFALIMVGLGELVMRMVTPDKGQYYQKAELDDRLGWRTKSDYSSTYTIFSKQNKSYDVEFKTENEGFRHYGNVNSERKKILVIGDSYTQAVEAASDSIYAKHTAEILDIELFCYGQAGYGTIQQCLHIEENVRNIEPDLVVLQMCDNDFIDNHAALECKSNYKVGLRRPYLNESNEIEYLVAKSNIQKIFEKSLFLDLIRRKLDVVFYNIENVAQYQIGQKGKEYPLYAESIQFTGKALDRLQKELGDIPLYILIVSDVEPYKSDLVNLCIHRNIPYATQPIEYVKQLELQKQDVRSSDGYHWTELGHRIVGEQLAIQLDSVVNSLN